MATELFIGVASAMAGVLVGVIIGYYKTLADMSKLYCLKTDCTAIRLECGKHRDYQDRRLNDGQIILTNIQIDVQDIKTTLKWLAEKTIQERVNHGMDNC